MRRHAAHRSKHSLEILEEGYFQLPIRTKHGGATLGLDGA